MNLFTVADSELSRVGFLIEQYIRNNSSNRFSMYEKNADLILNLGFTHDTGRNTLHTTLYDHTQLLLDMSQNICNTAKEKGIQADYGKIDKRIQIPDTMTLYIVFGRRGYEFDENSWAAAIAEGICSTLGEDIVIEKEKEYIKPAVEKTIFDRNFAQDPTRNSDIIFGR